MPPTIEEIEQEYERQVDENIRLRSKENRTAAEDLLLKQGIESAHNLRLLLDTAKLRYKFDGEKSITEFLQGRKKRETPEFMCGAEILKGTSCKNPVPVFGAKCLHHQIETK